MTSSNLIRLGGLAAMVGGVVYAGVAFLARPYFAEYLYYMSEIGYGFIAVLLPLGAMAAIAALHALQREHYGSAGALASLMAFVGLALFTGALTVGVVYSDSLGFDLPFNVLLIGLLVATIGISLLGALTIGTGILPRWCGVALIVGSLGFALAGLFGELWGALVGAGWALVGYAIFQMVAGQREEQPLRVR